MLSKSGKQHRFMGWAKSHPKESGVPTSVSEEFLKADTGRHFSKHEEKQRRKAKRQKAVDKWAQGRSSTPRD